MREPVSELPPPWTFHMPRAAELGPDPKPPGVRFRRLLDASEKQSRPQRVPSPRVRGFAPKNRRAHVGLQRGRHR